MHINVLDISDPKQLVSMLNGNDVTMAPLTDDQGHEVVIPLERDMQQTGMSLVEEVNYVVYTFIHHFPYH
jgi:hypothetical protein